MTSKKPHRFSDIRSRLAQELSIHPGMSDDLKSQSVTSKTPFRAEDISRRIFTIRGHRVMLDADIAELCRVCQSALARPVVRQLPHLLQELHHPQGVLPAGGAQVFFRLLPFFAAFDLFQQMKRAGIGNPALLRASVGSPRLFSRDSSRPTRVPGGPVPVTQRFPPHRCIPCPLPNPRIQTMRFPTPIPNPRFRTMRF